MKSISFVITILVFITGCSTWLRYNHERAMTLLPPRTTTVFTNSEYIRFYYTNDIYKKYYRAYYTSDGTIYQTVKE